MKKTASFTVFALLLFLAGCGNKGGNTASGTNAIQTNNIIVQGMPELTGIEPSQINDWKEWLAKYETVVNAYIDAMLRAGYPGTKEPTQEVVDYMTVVTKFAMDMGRINAGLSEADAKAFSDKVNEIDAGYVKAGLKK